MHGSQLTPTYTNTESERPSSSSSHNHTASLQEPIEKHHTVETIFHIHEQHLTDIHIYQKYMEVLQENVNTDLSIV